MSIQRIKQRFREIIHEYSDVDPYELRRIFMDTIRDRELEIGWEEERRRTPWTDDELRVVLSDAPTKENCLKHARGFGRGYGAIEQIYRWAATDAKRIAYKGRSDDAFIKQIKRVAKQLGCRA